MSDEAIIPTADAIIRPVLEKLYELRPNSFKHANLRSGVYWHPVLGYRAQTAKMLQRLAELAAARKLKTATGTDLLDYVASEFDAAPETEQTLAEGKVVLGRTNLAQPLAGGDYPKGTRVTRAPYTALGVFYPGAEYETLADAHIDVGSSAQVTVPIRATRPGADANHPLLTANASNQSVSIVNLVPNVSVAELHVGGGSDGPSDDFVRTFAKVAAVGQYGPTSNASKYGALRGAGVRYFLVFDRPETGTQNILIADASWASSDRWAGIVQQSIYDADLIGFGCKASVGKVRNQAITVEATVVLRDGTYLADTTKIDLAVHAAARAYFDDRPAWNTWNKESLRAAISRAHDRIYFCSAATVKDSSTNSEIGEIFLPDYSIEQLHFFLASNAMKITYTGPSV